VLLVFVAKDSTLFIASRSYVVFFVSFMQADPLPDKDKSSPAPVIYDTSTPSTRLQGRLTYSEDSAIEVSTVILHVVL
jgi:hypothetical protein